MVSKNAGPGASQALMNQIPLTPELKNAVDAAVNTGKIYTEMKFERMGVNK